MKKRSIIIAVCLVLGVLVWVALSKEKKDSSGSGKNAPAQSAQKVYAEAKEFNQSGEWLQAKEDYQKIMTDFPDYDQM